MASASSGIVRGGCPARAATNSACAARTAPRAGFALARSQGRVGGELSEGPFGSILPCFLTQTGRKATRPIPVATRAPEPPRKAQQRLAVGFLHKCDFMLSPLSKMVFSGTRTFVAL